MVLSVGRVQTPLSRRDTTLLVVHILAATASCVSPAAVRAAQRRVGHEPVLQCAITSSSARATPLLAVARHGSRDSWLELESARADGTSRRRFAGWAAIVLRPPRVGSAPLAVRDEPSADSRPIPRVRLHARSQVAFLRRRCTDLALAIEREQSQMSELLAGSGPAMVAIGTSGGRRIAARRREDLLDVGPGASRRSTYLPPKPANSLPGPVPTRAGPYSPSASATSFFSSRRSLSRTGAYARLRLRFFSSYGSRSRS